MIWATVRGAKSCPPVNHTVIAPDSGAEAVVWHYECGLGTGAMVGVRVRVGRDSSDRAVPVMTAMDTDVVHLLHGGFRRPRLEVAWRRGDTLDVGFDPTAKIMNREARVGTVAIRYHALAPIDSAGHPAASSPEGQ